MPGRVSPHATFYTDADKALGDVKPRPDTLENVRDKVKVCAACNKPPAPLGFGRELEYAEWLKQRAAEQPEDTLKNRIGLRQSMTDCSGCLSQTSLVIGIPSNLLSRILADLGDIKRRRIASFLAANFVFPICDRCRATESEHVRVTATDIEKRYRRVLKALHGHTRPPAGTAGTEADVLRLLNEAVRERDAAA